MVCLAPAMLSLLLAGSGSVQAGDEDRVIVGSTMGTFYRITLAVDPSKHTLHLLRRCADASLARIDELLSTWRSDSELARINARHSTGWLPVSPTTAAVVQEALFVSRLTGGALDPTLEPLLALWGFGPRARAVAGIPDREAVSRALVRVGHHRVVVRALPPAVRKKNPELSLDLSAVAKGFAADVLGVLVRVQGGGDYLINIGGEMRAGSEHLASRVWRVGVESPVPGEPSVLQVLALSRGALATSGTYRRTREVAGRHLADTLDPRTGAPVTHDLLAVSVLSASAARADALATGLLVLGPVQGPALARKQGIAALFVHGSQRAPMVLESPAFAAMATGPIRLPDTDDDDALALLAEVGCRNPGRP